MSVIVTALVAEAIAMSIFLAGVGLWLAIAGGHL